MTDADEIAARYDAMVAAGDWRGGVLIQLRGSLLAHDVEESIKWRKPSNPDGVAAYAHGGMIGTLEVYKDKVKFTFAKGGDLPEPANLSWTGAGIRRAVDVFEGDDVDLEGFSALVAAAVEANA